DRYALGITVRLIVQSVDWDRILGAQRAEVNRTVLLFLPHQARHEQQQRHQGIRRPGDAYSPDGEHGLSLRRQGNLRLRRIPSLALCLSPCLLVSLSSRLLRWAEVPFMARLPKVQKNRGDDQREDAAADIGHRIK